MSDEKDRPPLKILFMGDASKPNLIEWAEELEAHNIQCEVVTLHEYYTPVKPKIRVHFLEPIKFMRKFNYLFQTLNVRKIIREFRPDIIHAHYATNYGSLGSLLRTRPLIITTYGKDVLLSGLRLRFMYSMLKHSFSRASMITCDSRHLASKIELFNIPPAKVKHIIFGVKRSVFDQDKNIRAKHDENGTLILSSLKPLETNSNLENVLKALALVNHNFPNFKFMIGNTGPCESALAAACGELGISDKVYFLGKLSHADALTLLRESHLYFSVPSFDSTSISLLEAMALGAFPICSDIEANREWVSATNGAGFLINAADPVKLATRIEGAVKSHSQRQAAVDVNRSKIENLAILETNLKYLVSSYHEVLKKNDSE